MDIRGRVNQVCCLVAWGDICYLDSVEHLLQSKELVNKLHNGIDVLSYASHYGLDFDIWYRTDNQQYLSIIV